MSLEVQVLNTYILTNVDPIHCYLTCGSKYATMFIYI